MTVRELGARMGSREFTEWMAFFGFAPTSGRGGGAADAMAMMDRAFGIG